jgi:rod shape-determining protein MreB
LAKRWLWYNTFRVLSFSEACNFSRIKEYILPTNPLNWFWGLFSLDIGIDLGTANTLVSVQGKGIVINEPSWVAIDKKTRKPYAIGAQAKEMVGRTPANLIAVRPLRDGVISEFEITQAMLRYFIWKAHQQTFAPFPQPRVVIGIPSGATEVEKRAVIDAAMSAGARETYMIEEPRAAALGAGLPVEEVRGSMIVDIGGGTTEVAIIAMKGVVVSRSLRVAGDELDADIIQYVRNKYNLFIGERMAEQIKIAIGSAFPLSNEKTMSIRGRNLVTGLPETLEISSVEIREAISGSIQVIVDTIRDALDEAPPEILSDLIDSGICLAGGTSQLQGLADRLSDDLKVRVWVAEDPMTCVVRGCAIVLENLEKYSSFLVDMDRGPVR